MKKIVKRRDPPKSTTKIQKKEEHKKKMTKLYILQNILEKLMKIYRGGGDNVIK